jgi:NAD-dependent dihydropyrimidine dehydrogenase PreA subunit
MSDDVYQKLAEVLDTLPNGFPATESGLEIDLLKKIFRPDDAELFCELRLTFETAQQIAERTGRDMAGLEDHLAEMGRRGQIAMIDFGEVKVFKMVPWVFGIYEFQLPHLDRELAEMCNRYMKVFSGQFHATKPQLMQVVPVEKQIPNRQIALRHEQVSSIIESSQSFAVFDCICKKEKHILGHGCDKPLESCTAYAPVPDVFENMPHFRAISKQEAYDVLEKAEAAALVHLTWNVQNGHYFICNCCGCCCGVLGSINNLGMDAATVINSYYYARIDPDACVACGVCKEERCQVNAVVEEDDTYRVIQEKCIGCGLCIDTCPSDAISLVRKPQEAIETPPQDEMEWFDRRGAARGRDFSRFR